ncbi:MAG TPA: hypothetical protein VLF40_04645 [Candidatus Saccharimonadales bacterium]|nr:hypothetical protein [Candidatus Saccharimonadales bacterium]
MPASKRPNKRAVLLRVGVSVVLLAAAAFVLARNWSVVHRSLELARGASIPWLVVSLLLVVVVYGLSAVCIGVLALHKLRLAETFLVELSTAFVNRLLPAALGSLGLVGYYLFKRKHTAAEATVVVSINNLVGITVHVTLLAGVLVFYPSVLHRFLDGRHFHLAWPVVSVLA